MRTSRSSRCPDVSDKLSSRHVLTEADDGASQVRIQCLRAVVVRNNYIVAITAVPPAIASRNDDNTACGRIYRRTARSAQIDPIPTMKSLSNDCSWDRIAKISGKYCTTGTTQRFFDDAT